MKDGPKPIKHQRRPAQLPPIEELRYRFDYDPVTGVIRWKNSKYPAKNGKIAGHADKETGRRVIILKPYSKLYAARVAWAIHYGEWPEGIVDHENRNPADDRINNLVDTNTTKNVINAGVQANSTTGVTGVTWIKRDQKFGARINVNGRLISLGNYTTIESAARARRKAEQKYWGT